MNSITSFFAGIMAFVSTLFGHTIQQTITPSPIAIIEASITQVSTTTSIKLEILPKITYQYGYNSDYKYFKDSKNVYIKMENTEMKKIEEADPETFSLDVPSISTSSYNYYLEFSKDKKHIYFEGKLTPFSQNFILVDPGNRKDCGGGIYASDTINGKRVIFVPDYEKENDTRTSFVELQDADPDTFTVLWTGYSKDKNYVYLGTSTTKDNPKKFNIDDAYKACPMG